MIKKPKIIPFPRIGKPKFKDVLGKTKHLSRKEQVYLSISNKNKDLKIFQIGNKREKRKVGYNLEEIYFLKQLSKNKNISLIHTHITKNNLKYGALPSKEDIISIFKTHSKIKHKYELIISIDKSGKEVGYTILKLDKIRKIFFSEFENTLKNFELNLLLTKKKLTKENYIHFLEKNGIEIYFTPSPGYKLNSNYTFIQK